MGQEEGGADPSFYIKSKLTEGVKDIFSIEKGLAEDSTFTAFKSDGSVVSWGGQIGEIDSSMKSLTRKCKEDICTNPSMMYPLSGGVKEVFSKNAYFFAFRNDGSVVIWGDEFPTLLDGAQDEFFQEDDNDELPWAVNNNNEYEKKAHILYSDIKTENVLVAEDEGFATLYVS